MMASFKLTYFYLRGRAEVTRLLFALAGKEYEDVRIPWEEWPKIKPTTPLGKLPVLTAGGKEIPQSTAIERYLAREFGFYGKGNLENTMCDVIIETINDVKPIISLWVRATDQNQKEEHAKNLKETVIPNVMKFIEKTLTENGGQYLVGSGVTVADLNVFNYLEQLASFFGNEIYNTSSTVKAHCEKIGSIPQIEKWVKERPENTEQFKGLHKSA